MEILLIGLVILGVFLWCVWSFFSYLVRLLKKLTKPPRETFILDGTKWDSSDFIPIESESDYWDRIKRETRDTDPDWQLPASDKQVALLRRLKIQREVESDIYLDGLTRLEASDLIDEWKALPFRKTRG
ncbi:MAG: hypothetical protein F4122_09885 [Gammaproteobacteria bacterium]|nr:hypothetical protein [Gammaproteobacteria bacterium]MYE29396.1 hypothetical protein [Gammaproteobacteria bacterium]MYI02802.1 hypothetical protein [Gammaproteobacteria bacterium]